MLSKETLDRMALDGVINKHGCIYTLDFTNGEFTAVMINADFVTPLPQHGFYDDLSHLFLECTIIEQPGVLDKIKSLDSLKNHMMNKDLREFIYRTKNVEDIWRRCIVQIILRDEGVPHYAVISIMNIDVTTSNMMDNQSKINERNALLSSFAVDFEYVAYVDLGQGELSTVRIDEKLRPIWDSTDASLPQNNRFDAFLNTMIYSEDRDMLMHSYTEKNELHKAFNTAQFARFRVLIGGKLIHYRMKYVPDVNNPGCFILGMQNDESVFQNELKYNRNNEIFKILADNYSGIYYLDLVTMQCEVYAHETTVDELISKTLGYSQAIAYYISEYVHPDDREMLFDVMNNLMDKLNRKKSVSTVYRMLYDGRYLYTQMRVVKINPEDEPATALLFAFAQKDDEYRSAQAKEKALKESISALYDGINPDESMMQLLKVITEYHDADAGFIYELNKDRSLMKNTYMYQNKTITEKSDMMGFVPTNMFEDDKTGNLYTAPIVANGVVMGIIGVENPREAVNDMMVLRTVATLSYGEILRRKQTDEDHLILDKVVTNFMAVCYVDYSSNYFKAYTVIEKFRNSFSGLSNIEEVKEFLLDNFVHAEDKERVREEIAPERVISQFKYRNSFSVTFREISEDITKDCELQYIKANSEGTKAIICCVDNTAIIRQEKLIQEKLSEAKDMAIAASKAKSDFLSRMSHDIRTPINGVIGMTEIAGKHVDDPVRIKDCLEKIDTASHHLLSLINDVLDMTRIENGKTEIIEKPMNVLTFIENCCSIINGQVTEKKQKLVRDYSRLIHTDVMGDELHLRQVLINILSNAVKFTPDKGVITLKAWEGGSTADRAEYHIEVTDTGIGMSDEYLNHIFEAFTQEVDESRTNYVGSGLGMTITKQLLELMGGEIHVKSKLGEGSTFTIDICLSTNIDAVPVRFTSTTKSIKGTKILLVEDNELNREIAEELLTDEGAVVTCATNGKEALEMFAVSDLNYYDVILMDIMMPIMDGLTATKNIRFLNRPDALTVPIIAMTANAFEEDVQRSKEAGMNDHLSKPVQIPALLKTLSNYIK